MPTLQRPNILVPLCPTSRSYTYLGAPQGGPFGAPAPLPAWAPAVELAIAALFLCHFILDLVTAKHVRSHLTQPQTLVDVLTLLPALTFAQGALPASIWPELLPQLRPGETLPLWVQLVRLCRVLRLTHTYALGRRFLQSEIQHQLFQIGYTVSNLVIISAAAVHVAENHVSMWPAYEIDTRHLVGLTFFDCLYFIVITLCTIGFGDIAPITTVGRCVVMSAVLVELLLIPQQTNKLVELLARRSEWVRSSFAPIPQHQHILVVGNVNGGGAGGGGGGGGGAGASASSASSGNISAFFREFFDEDHGSAASRYAVVLSKGQPTREIQMLLGHPAYGHGLTYLDGSVMVERDLERAAAGQARAAFVLCDKFAEHPDLEDSRTILAALSVKRQVFGSHARDIPVFVQLIRPENMNLFNTTMASQRHYVASRLKRAISTGARAGPAAAAAAATSRLKLAQPASLLVQPLPSSSSSGPLLQEPHALASRWALFSSADARQQAAVVGLDHGGSTLPESPAAPELIGESQLFGIRVTRGEGDSAASARVTAAFADSEAGAGASKGEDGNHSEAGADKRGATAAKAPATRTLLAADESVSDASNDLAVCVQEIKLNLLAKSCLCPGLATLVHNLVTSHNEEEGDGDAEDEEDSEGEGENEGEGNSGGTSRGGGDAASGDETGGGASLRRRWLREYCAGMEFEIYRAALSPVFEGVPFAQVAAAVYAQAGIVLFALDLDAVSATPARTRARFVLSPCGLAIPPMHLVRTFGFVIAEDKEVADILTVFGTARDPERAARLDALARAQRIVASLQSRRAGKEVAPSGTALRSRSTEAASAIPPSPTRRSGVGAATRATTIALAPDADEVAARLDRMLRDREISNHVIVITSDFRNLPSFVAPLRAQHLHDESVADVVVMNPSVPNRQHWSKTCMLYDRVHFLQGSPFEAADLLRAGIMHARAVVLFSFSGGSAEGSTSGGVGQEEAAAADPMYICIYRLARTLNPGVEIVCELALQSNIPFLANSGSIGQAFTSAPFAAGHVFNPAMLDILLVQCFFNNHLITALTHLLTGGEHEAAHNQLWLERAARLGLAPLFERLEDSHIHLVSLPPRWTRPSWAAGREARHAPTYGELFARLAFTRGALCLALRRESAPASVPPPPPAQATSMHGVQLRRQSSKGSQGSLNRQVPSQEPQQTPLSSADIGDSLPDVRKIDSSADVEEDAGGGRGTKPRMAAPFMHRTASAAAGDMLARGLARLSSLSPSMMAHAFGGSLRFQSSMRIRPATAAEENSLGEGRRSSLASDSSDSTESSDDGAEAVGEDAAGGNDSMGPIRRPETRSATKGTRRPKLQSSSKLRSEAEQAAERRRNERSAEAKAHCLPYVYTNPASATVLRAGDAVFVLCSEDPRSWSHEWRAGVPVG